MITHMDGQIGRIIQTLEETGQADTATPRQTGEKPPKIRKRNNKSLYRPRLHSLLDRSSVIAGWARRADADTPLVEMLSDGKLFQVFETFEQPFLGGLVLDDPPALIRNNDKPSPIFHPPHGGCIP